MLPGLGGNLTLWGSSQLQDSLGLCIPPWFHHRFEAGVISISVVLAAVEGRGSDFPALMDEALGVVGAEPLLQPHSGVAGAISGQTTSKLILKGVW